VVQHICLVCGYNGLEEPPYISGTDAGSFEICPCCKFQYGYTGSAHGKAYHKTYRKEWITNGAKWFDESEKPPNWDLKKQLKNINVEI
jgi:hypothetical protein